MIRLMDLSIQKPILLQCEKDNSDATVETTVLAIDHLHNIIIAVDWETGLPIKINCMDSNIDKKTSLTYQVLRPLDNTILREGELWIIL